jgi:hypothetical protein
VRRAPLQRSLALFQLWVWLVMQVVGTWVLAVPSSSSPQPIKRSSFQLVWLCACLELDQDLPISSSSVIPLCLCFSDKGSDGVALSVNSPIILVCFMRSQFCVHACHHCVAVPWGPVGVLAAIPTERLHVDFHLSQLQHVVPFTVSLFSLVITAVRVGKYVLCQVCQGSQGHHPEQH